LNAPLNVITIKIANSRRVRVIVSVFTRRLQKLTTTAALLLLTACQTYTQGSGRTVGEFTDDVGIQAAVKTALMRDKEVNGLAVDVDVNRSVVALHGRVPSEYVRNKAVKLAREVRGVSRVDDRLTLIDD
jgi:hyperosmotically inducible protein